MSLVPLIIQSGGFQTPNSTPTNTPKKIAVDNPYISKDEFIASPEAVGLGINASSQFYAPSQFGIPSELDKRIIMASAFINRYCGRHFDTQTIDETRTNFYVRPYNPQLVSVDLANAPYQKINSVFIEVLKWFIQIDISTGYLQDFPDYGYYRIVPLLSSAGTGLGSPIPAAILDRVALGVVWTNYTFGFGKVVTGYNVGTGDGATVQFQSLIGNRLWAPDQTFNVYLNGVLQNPSLYAVDYANGIIQFNSAPGNGVAVTMDFTTNESIPFDVKTACHLLTAHFIGRRIHNPVGASRVSIQTYSIDFGEEGELMREAKKLLDPYKINEFKII